MSKTIDERVVQMQFDNRQFERNVETSIGSIDKLKNSLDFSGASKGLEQVNSTAKGMDLSVLSGAVGTVQAKFSALQVMAITALANITNSAVNSGKRIISALTVDPIKTGLSEYETQIGAVQTILANTESKGSTLADVNAALDQLNTYADKTIYNFTEMTRNIGTFTAAGVDLDTSVTAIQGIANLAAVSGSTSQQASTAMYQLSQALSSGTVKLMDWNSVVNAGMGGQVFQDALKETAKNQGVAIDDLIAKHGSFRETLQEGWLTSEVLLETLEKFTMSTEGLTDAEIDANRQRLKAKGYTDEQIDSIFKLGNTATNAATKVKTMTQLWDTLKETAQSGWTQTWEILFGDFEEAKTLFSDAYNAIAPMIEAMSEARNEMLENWKVMGGRTDAIESIKNLAKGILNIVEPIKTAFAEIFPRMTSERLYEITHGLRETTEAFANLFKGGSKNATNLKKTFKGLFAVLDIARMAIVAAVKAVGSLFGVVGKLGGGFLDTTASIGDWLTSLRNTIKEGDFFGKVFGGIIGLVKKSAEGISKFISFAKSKFVCPGLEFAHKVLEKVVGMMSGVGDATSGMVSGISNVFESLGNALENCGLFRILEGLWNLTTTVFKAVFNAVKSLTGGIFKAVGITDFTTFLDLVKTVIAGGVGISIMKFFNGFSGGLSGMAKSITGMFEGVSEVIKGAGGILDGVRDTLSAYQTQLKAGALIKIAAAIAILTVSLILLASIESDRLTDALSAMIMLFAGLTGTMAIVSKMTGPSGLIQLTTSMVAMSTAILILATAVKSIADLDMGSMIQGIWGIAALITMMVITTKMLATGKKDKQTIKGVTQMILFAAAIKVLASVCSDLGEMDTGSMVKGLSGIAALIAMMIATTKLIATGKDDKKVIQGATKMILFAASLKILASVCSDLGNMDTASMIQGLAGVAALIAMMIATTKLIATGKDDKKVIQGATKMILFGAALKILASVCTDLAALSWEDLARGMMGIGALMTGVVIVAQQLSKGGGSVVEGALRILIFSAALKVLASSCSDISGLGWDGLARGLLGIGGMLVILAIGLRAMQGTIAGSAALIIASIALAALVPSLMLLGAMSWSAIGKGLLAMAGAFLVLGIAGVTLAPIVGVISALSTSMLFMGAGMLAAGLGMTVFAAGIAALVAALGVGVKAIVAFIGGLFNTIIMLLPNLFAAFANGFVLFISTIGDAAQQIGAAFSKIFLAIAGVIIDTMPALGEVIKVLVITLVGVLVECTPVIVDGVLKIIVGLLVALVEYTPQLVDSLFQFLIGVLDGLARNIPGLIEAAVKVLMSVFQGIVDALKNIDPKVIMDGIVSVGIIAGVMAALAAVSALIPAAMLGAVGVGLVIAELAAIFAAIGLLAQLPGLEWLINEGGDLLQAIGTAIGKFVGGLVGGFMGGVSAQFPQIGADLSAFMINAKPFIEGVKSADASAMKGIQALATAILVLTAANILNGLTSWFTGGSSFLTFGMDLAAFAPYFVSYYNAIKCVDGTVVEASANAALALAEMANKLPNSGGVVSWFAGDNSLAAFGAELASFGPHMKAYAASVAGIDPTVVTASASAALALAEMADKLPNSGGVASWFTGDNTLSAFGAELAKFGPHMKAYAESVAGITPSAVTASADAALSLAKMANELPNMGGVTGWWSGDKSLGAFGEQLAKLGDVLKVYSDKSQALDISAMTKATNGFKSIAKTVNSVSGIDFTSISSFANSLGKIGKGGVDAFVEVFDGASKKVSDSGKAFIEKFIDGANSKTKDVESAAEDIADKAASSAKKAYQGFYDAGNHLVGGFAKGISENSYRAEAKAKAMAEAAELAARQALAINSPSKVFRKIGTSVPEGFAQGISKLGNLVSGSSKAMATGAVDSVRSSLAKLADYVNSDIDTQPTIRPVIDLSDVKSGARTIGSLFGSGSVGVLANVSGISAVMNRRSQNGANDDVISAIDKLRKDIKDSPRTVNNVNGVTYDDGSNVAEAVKVLVRAATVERRK